MRTRLSWGDGVALIVLLLPIVYQCCVYARIPSTVALHFNYKGVADHWGDKSKTWFPLLLLTVMALGVGLLVRFLPAIDPKKKVRYSEATLVKISYALVFFLTALNLMIVHSRLTGHFALERGFYPVVCLLYVYLGNLFNTIKPNYFVGIRTPWTLENENVWRKTHHWGGRLWVVGGLVLAMTTFVLPQGAAFVVFMSGTVLLALAPVVFSYWYYRQIQNNA